MIINSMVVMAVLMGVWVCGVVCHWYSDIIISATASQITNVSIVCSTVCSGADKKKNIKSPRHWPLWGESIGDRWISLTKGQWRGKYFHLMTSSWDIGHISQCQNTTKHKRELCVHSSSEILNTIILFFNLATQLMFWYRPMLIKPES